MTFLLPKSAFAKRRDFEQMLRNVHFRGDRFFKGISCKVDRESMTALTDDFHVYWETHILSVDSDDGGPGIFIMMHVTPMRLIEDAPDEYLLRHIRDEIIKHITHEADEFFEFNGERPFHPHRASGFVNKVQSSEFTVNYKP